MSPLPLETPNELIDPSGEQFDLIVFGHRERLGPEDLGFTMRDKPAGVGDLEVASPGNHPDEMHLEVEHQDEPIESGKRPPESAQDDAIMQEALADEPSAVPITVGDVPTTTLKTLRAACAALGVVGKSGSRATLFRRLVDRLKTLELAAAARAAEGSSASSVPQGSVPRQPAEPTPEQRRAHEATHCPNESWCERCIALRGRDDAHPETKGSEDRMPCISFDYGFSARDEGESKLDGIVCA